jgi:hypothetical protein
MRQSASSEAHAALPEGSWGAQDRSEPRPDDTHVVSAAIGFLQHRFDLMLQTCK